MANASSLAGFESALTTLSGKASLEITAPGGVFDERRIPGLEWLARYGTLSPVIEGDAWVSAPRGGEAVRVLGVDILRDRSLRDYLLLDFPGGGRPGTREFLSLLMDPRSVVLTGRFADRLGLRVGQEVEITFGDRKLPFTVRGLLRDTGLARALDGNVALMDIAAAQWAFDSLGRITRVDIRLHESTAVDEAERQISNRLPQELAVGRPARRGRAVEKMLAAYHFNLSALSWVSLLVGLFMIYNTVAVSVAARREEVGSLRALGAGRPAVLGLFLGESLILALGGCSIGLILARYLALAAVSLTSTTVAVLYRGVVAPPPALGIIDVTLAFAVGVPLALVSAAIPAWEASRVPPATAARGYDRLETRYRLSRRHFLIPAALLFAGGVLSQLPAVDGLPVFGFFSALFIVFGGASTTPLILFLLARGGKEPLARMLKVEGLLAHANLSGAVPRLAVSVAALSLGLSMMVAIAVMVGSFRETVIYWVGQTLRADLYLSPATRGIGGGPAALSDEVWKTAAADPAVAAADPFRRVEVPFGESTVTMGCADFRVLADHGGLMFKSPADALRRMREAAGRDEVVVSESFNLKHRKGPGDTVVLPVRQGRASFRIAAVYFDYSSDRGIVLMDRGSWLRHFDDAVPTSLALYLKPGQDPDRARSRILAALGDRHRVFLNTNDSVRREILRIFDSTFAVTWALEAIAIFVAILGVSTTLLTLTYERRRELATLRLIGADTGQVTKMIVLEAGMLGAASQCVGIAVGVLLSLLLIYVINVQSFGWTIQFHLPAKFLAQASAAILAATALAGLYPARRACGFRPSDQVAEE
jgi:putative ABC transport system permease protein